MDPFGSQLFSGSGVLGTLSAVMVVAAEVDDPGGDASKRLSMAILGLLILAGLILAATIVYWRMTRPERATAEATGMKWVEPVAAAADLDAASQDRPTTPPVASSPSPVPAVPDAATVAPDVAPSPVAATVANPPLATRPTVTRPAARPPAPGPDAVAG